MRRAAAIMQPTFLPWMGYFALMDAVDAFVFLDDVQFSKQSWQSRNRILGPNGPVILGLPVARKPSKPIINSAKIAQAPVRTDILKRARGCLGTAPFWPLVEDILTEGLARPDDGLGAVNIGLITRIAGLLGIRPTLHRSGDLAPEGGDKSDRLLTMCRALEVAEYLSPMGALNYLREANPFQEADIRLRFQNFDHPVYAQRWGAFTSHMSVIDALAYLGPDATAALIRGGIGAAHRIDEIEGGADDDAV